MAAKVISINKRIQPTGCIVENFSLVECKKILNADGIEYNDEEVIIVRDFLHQLAEINYLYYLEWKQKQNETKIIDINENTSNEERNDETQSDIVCSSEYRRAS